MNLPEQLSSVLRLVAPGKIAHVELQIVTHDTQATLHNLHVAQCRLDVEVWTHLATVPIRYEVGE